MIKDAIANFGEIAISRTYPAPRPPKVFLILGLCANDQCRQGVRSHPKKGWLGIADVNVHYHSLRALGKLKEAWGHSPEMAVFRPIAFGSRKFVNARRPVRTYSPEWPFEGSVRSYLNRDST